MSSVLGLIPPSGYYFKFFANAGAKLWCFSNIATKKCWQRLAANKYQRCQRLPTIANGRQQLPTIANSHRLLSLSNQTEVLLNSTYSISILIIFAIPIILNIHIAIIRR